MTKKFLLKTPSRRSRDDEEEFKKINFEISSILKQRVASLHKSTDLGKKIEKAQKTRIVQTKGTPSKFHKIPDESIYNSRFMK